MKTSKIIYTILFAAVMFAGCGASCTGNSTDRTPYIREQPGIEFCKPWCDHMETLAKTDPQPDLCTQYLEPIVLQEDAGTMDCVAYCEYEMKNSIQLNPECMSKVNRCEQVECASYLSPGECNNIDNTCK